MVCFVFDTPKLSRKTKCGYRNTSLFGRVFLRYKKGQKGVGNVEVSGDISGN
jgi:hypothetical protein